jgi:hypothetical protein
MQHKEEKDFFFWEYSNTLLGLQELESNCCLISQCISSHRSVLLIVPNFSDQQRQSENVSQEWNGSLDPTTDEE